MNEQTVPMETSMERTEKRRTSTRFLVVSVAFLLVEVLAGAAVIVGAPAASMHFVSRGDAEAKQHNFKDAIADFSVAIRLDPRNAAAYVERANAYEGSGEPDKALADYWRAIHLQPHHAAANINRGEQYRQALADCHDAIRLKPNAAPLP